MQDQKIAIVGAGLSGLVTAINLEQAGFKPQLFEATDRVGGRVKTDYRDGYTFDHGFQVLLTEYPATQKYLNYDLLELQHFYPGSVIYNKGQLDKIGDPLRQFSLLWPTLTSKIGSVADKLKVLKLNTELKKKSFDDIFLAEEKTTLQYLKDYGFSEDIIHNFFRPFFTGIFLEHELKTSSRKFEFVYKMFGKGSAAIPKKGIQAIPNQLMAQLKQTKIHFNTPVKSVQDQEVTFVNDSKETFDYVIIATEASYLIPNLKNQHSLWKSVDNFYVSVKQRAFKEPMIALIADEEALVNNIYYVSKPNAEEHILSVSIVKPHKLSNEELKERVTQDLKTYAGIDTIDFKQFYHINKALPIMQTVNYMLPRSETQLKDQVFLAGDHLANGSINAAMLNGESAAQAVISKIKDGIINLS
ncbi:FAD-dependent oxidoreductase [Psychroflexus sp. CAK57W]|uniref:NAD(P)/FAD-dependent oxidoreductase n=1 Tax=Psychroflexus curvus TaxID=2873595 RepID=UPI001CCA3250|nr:NAD(P)/FAD-dependent oxidoreductase [Psychroflexus curvus]MBZ9626883.1 FAD-dependent oxidoreductase [Psychroflexus curvus]MBZ9786657.1 FAD-dependent oxidoreductase [Psychroflexus curvus]